MQTETKIILAPTWALAQTVEADVTIEAEYGSNVAVGRLATAAHHQQSGPWSESAPAPCNDQRLSALDPSQVGVILVSHLDLDTIGGCLRAMGVTDLFGPAFEDFWAIAEAVDLRGPSAAEDDDWQAYDVDVNALHAWWAWSAANRGPTAEGTVLDVTEYVARAAKILGRIFDRDEDLLTAGRHYRADLAAKERQSFVREASGVVLRRSPGFFVNAFYGEASAVVGYNDMTGVVTISCRPDRWPGLDCRALAQALWGPEAGGRASIAGSPRGQRLPCQEAERAFETLRLACGLVRLCPDGIAVERDDGDVVVPAVVETVKADDAVLVVTVLVPWGRVMLREHPTSAPWLSAWPAYAAAEAARVAQNAARAVLQVADSMQRQRESAARRAAALAGPWAAWVDGRDPVEPPAPPIGRWHDPAGMAERAGYERHNSITTWITCGGRAPWVC